MLGACVPAECRRCGRSVISPLRLRLPRNRTQLMTQKGMQMPPIPALWSSLRLTCSPHCTRTALLGSVSRTHLSHKHRSHRQIQDRQLPQAAMSQRHKTDHKISRNLTHSPSLLFTSARTQKCPRLRERHLNRGRTTLARLCAVRRGPAVEAVACPPRRHQMTRLVLVGAEPAQVVLPGPATAEEQHSAPREG